MARVFVDGALANGNVDTFVPTPTEGTQNVIFTASGLTPGAHTITILATGTGNPASTGTGVVVDAFDVTP
jgi:bacillopeptidase F